MAMMRSEASQRALILVLLAGGRTGDGSVEPEVSNRAVLRECRPP
jgi:hypothetical protein